MIILRMLVFYVYSQMEDNDKMNLHGTCTTDVKRTIIFIYFFFVFSCLVLVYLESFLLEKLTVTLLFLASNPSSIAFENTHNRLTSVLCNVCGYRWILYHLLRTYKVPLVLYRNYSRRSKNCLHYRKFTLGALFTLTINSAFFYLTSCASNWFADHNE